MHELSIAMSLVEVASEEARRLHPARVEALRLRIGPLSGVVIEALTFSFDLAARDSEIEGARLVIEAVPLVVYCPTCDAEREIPSPQHLRCSECGTSTPEVRRGRELELFALEVTEDVAPNS